MSTIPQVSNAEWEVMQIIWEKAPVKSSDIVKCLQTEKSWSAKTIQTLIRRLLDKGMISKTVAGRAYIYNVIIPKEEYVKKETAGFLKRIYKGSFSHLLLNFVKNNKLSDNEVEELISILKNKND